MSSYADLSNTLKSSIASAGFKGDLLIHGDADYAASLNRWAKNSQKNAALVAGVKSAEDVALVIKSLQAYTVKAGTKPVEIAIRSGGHSPSGTSGSEGGVVIDLSRHLNTVRVDKEKKLAYAGAGCTWETVDCECIKHGLAAVGATINNVGVGGFTLVGGYGWLTGEHGLAIDNLVQATVVTASGEILTANATTNPDLYWGLRGGGSNFGCVTEFVYQLHEQRTHVYAGPLIFPPPMMPAVAKAIQEWYPNASPKESIMLITTTKSPTPEKFPAIVANLFYNGDAEEGKKKFAKFYEIGPVADMSGMVPYEALGGLFRHGLPAGANYHVMGSAFRPKGLTPDMGQAIFQQLMEKANAPGPAVAGENTPMIGLVWELHSSKKLTGVAADATAYPRRLPDPLITMLISWEGDSVEATRDAEGRLATVKSQVVEIIKPSFGHGYKQEEDMGYGNVESSDYQTHEAAQRLFSGNYARLQQLKGKYDPGLLFKAWYPIKPSTA